MTASRPPMDRQKNARRNREEVGSLFPYRPPTGPKLPSDAGTDTEKDSRPPCAMSGIHFIWRQAALILAIVFGAAAGAPGQVVWELTPYRIQVFMAMGRSAELTEQLEEDLRTELPHLVAARIGAAWDATFAAAPPPLERAMRSGLANVTVEQIPEEVLDFDKVLLLAISEDLAGYHVAGRELDGRTRTWNPAVVGTALHPARLRDTAFRVMCDAFAPVARIEEVDKKSVLLRLRAAALAPRRNNGISAGRHGCPHDRRASPRNGCRQCCVRSRGRK